MLLAFVLAGFGPSAGDEPKLLLQILAAGVTTALLYTSLSLACFELHGPAGRRGRRHRAAAVRAGCGAVGDRERGRAQRVDLISSPFVAFDLAYRIFDEEPDHRQPVSELQTLVVVGGLGATILLGAFVCWLRYRRLESFR